MNPRLKKSHESEVEDLNTAPEVAQAKHSKEDKLRKSVKSGTQKQRKILKIVFALIGALVLAWIVFVCATRWIVFSDTSDIQGTWKIEGSEKEVPITNNEMTLTEDLTYSYTLDESSKTIEVTLGSMSGRSHYSFSLDRKQLVIIDGEYDFITSLATDISDFFASIFSGTISPQSAGFKSDTSGKTIIRLNKVS